MKEGILKSPWLPAENAVSSMASDFITLFPAIWNLLKTVSGNCEAAKESIKKTQVRNSGRCSVGYSF
jgi:hypothetical protein